MRLSEVAKLLGVDLAVDDREVNGFSTDSRSIEPESVFVALRGENFDGHDYVEASAGKGAVAAIVARDWAAGHDVPIPLLVVDNPLAAYGTLARAHRKRFSYPVVAVAGSNGKTTTKELISAVLKRHFEVHHTTGNLNNMIGVPATMLRMEAGHTAAVVEIGTNSPGEIEQLCRILEPTHGIITNIGREHLELLGSIEGVAEEEGALFRYLDANGGTAFVNYDDMQLVRISGGLKRRVTYGTTGEADVRGRVLEMNENFAPVVEITAGGKSFTVNMKLPGLHSATNAIAAAAVGVSLGVPADLVRDALEAFEPLVGHSGYARLAPVRSASGALILNDTYNANPDSMLVAFRTIEAMSARGRKILILGDMRELGASSIAEHRSLGQEIGKVEGIDSVYFVGTDMKHAHEALHGAKVASHHFSEKMALIGAVRREVREGDVVLVKGSRGMKMEEVVAALL
jgi:UDP-N-acetylmuramoyl-tripeptide--D-alanyl-D-alanine ligase